jgi:DNA-directed RNA polymerase subunit RPC12/RpoP
MTTMIMTIVANQTAEIELKKENKSFDDLACMNCGADLKFKPGTTLLVCDYCKATNEIPKVEAEIQELDFDAHLAKAGLKEKKLDIQMVVCGNCGATASIDPNIRSSACPYCATPIVLDHAHNESVIEPKSILPFALDKKQALAAFRKWIKGLWFAPDKLKKAALCETEFKSVYLPYWSYDANTHSNYIGQRGTYYYVNETVRSSDEKDETRQVQKVRWTTVSGQVSTNFDDVLVPATESVTHDHLTALEPWDLEHLVPFEKSFLSGMVTEKYSVGLERGFDIAKETMVNGIREMVRRNIGGDTQRILRLNPHFNTITFKHILLPVYICSYRFQKRVFSFLINARTGEVQGQRPWSWIKISVVGLLLSAVIGLLYFLSQGTLH